MEVPPDAGRDYARTRSGYASDTMDEDWKRLEPFTPSPRSRGVAIAVSRLAAVKTIDDVDAPASAVVWR